MIIMLDSFVRAIEVVKKLSHCEFQMSIFDLIVEILPNKELIFENTDNVFFDLVVSEIHSFGYEVYNSLFVNSSDLIV